MTIQLKTFEKYYYLTKILLPHSCPSLAKFNSDTWDWQRKTTDFDHDGDWDLFVGGRVNPNRYPEPVNSFIYRNDSKNGKVRFTDVTKEY